MPFLLFFSMASFYLLSRIQGVAGHGYVLSVSVGGKDYQGWDPNTDPYTKPPPTRFIRNIPNDGPVDPNSSGLACNTGGEHGTHTGVADAEAGSRITFHWKTWPVTHYGPVSTYMTSCNGKCTDFSVENAKWFKLDGGSYISNNKTWATDQLIKNNNSWTSTIPAQLKAGQYLVRNEIVALHGAPADVQHYPSCAQVQVTGSGTGVPSDSDLAFLKDTYPRQWPDIWADGFHSLDIPGPAPVAFDKSAAAGNTTQPPTATPSKKTCGISAKHQPTSTSTTPASRRTKCASRRRRGLGGSIGRNGL